MFSKMFVAGSALGLALCSAVQAADEIVVGYAAPSLDGAQSQIQGGFLVVA